MIPFLRNLVLRDFWLKLFSLGLAGVFWVTVNMMRNSENPARPLSLTPPVTLVFSNLPVMIMSSAADVRSLRVNPKQIEVTVQGDRKIVQDLKPRDIRVLVDLTGIEAAHDLRQRIQVSTPPGVAYVKADPDEVQVIFPQKE